MRAESKEFITHKYIIKIFNSYQTIVQSHPGYKYFDSLLISYASIKYVINLHTVLPYNI